MTKKEKILDFKMCLIGSCAVGKTAIFKKISSNEFVPSISTIGVSKYTINYNDIEMNIDDNIVKKSFKISLFDTAGQERYQSITKNYYFNSDAMILIYDITNKDSFDQIGEWLSSVREVLSDPDYLVMLLGNKLDLVDEFPDKRKVKVEEGKQKSEEFGIIWGGECSAKNFSSIDLKNLLTDIK